MLHLSYAQAIDSNNKTLYIRWKNLLLCLWSVGFHKFLVRDIWHNQLIYVRSFVCGDHRKRFRDTYRFSNDVLTLVTRLIVLWIANVTCAARVLVCIFGSYMSPLLKLSKYSVVKNVIAVVTCADSFDCVGVSCIFFFSKYYL